MNANRIQKRTHLRLVRKGVDATERERSETRDQRASHDDVKREALASRSVLQFTAGRPSNGRTGVLH